MEKTFKNCQSCGMPLKDDPKKGGTNANGTTSAMYCSYCYENGKFTQPDWTANQMEAFVKEKLRELGGIHKLFTGFFAKGTHRLERWKSK